MFRKTKSYGMLLVYELWLNKITIWLSKKLRVYSLWALFSCLWAYRFFYGALLWLINQNIHCHLGCLFNLSIRYPPWLLHLSPFPPSWLSILFWHSRSVIILYHIILLCRGHNFRSLSYWTSIIYLSWTS